jgi:hypothetical protein
MLIVGGIIIGFFGLVAWACCKVAGEADEKMGLK